MLIALSAAILAALAWAYLLAGHGGFWRTDQRLPSPPAGRRGESLSWPAVVAVIPARDEANVLRQTLPTLLTQEYPGSMTVILVDDQSTDGTADVAEGLSQEAGVSDPEYGQRLKVIAGEPLPSGWAGKVWAMSQGFKAAGDAEYVLFTDADIGYAPGTVTELVRAAQGNGLTYLSQMALLRAQTPAERLLVPAFVYFFAQLYPFRRVNRRSSRTAAAAGGCMLVWRSALEAAGGLEPIRGARIDDVALGTLLKRSSADNECWLGFTADVISSRRYDTLGEVWDMVARSAYTQLGYSPAALAGSVIALAWLYLLPVAATVAGVVLLAGGQGLSGVTATQAGLLTVAGFAGWAIMSLTYLPMLRLYRLSALRAPSLPLITSLYMAMTISSAWRHYAGRGGEWKGRTIQRGRSD
jgi:hopene-associated glycosyltransferase HpnB